MKGKAHEDMIRGVKRKVEPKQVEDLNRKKRDLARKMGAPGIKSNFSGKTYKA